MVVTTGLVATVFTAFTARAAAGGAAFFFAVGLAGLVTRAAFVAGAGDLAAGLDVFFFMTVLVVTGGLANPDSIPTLANAGPMR